MNVVITGVSKGIGFGLTHEALKKGFTVYGVARRPQESDELKLLQKEFPALKLITLDLMDEEAGIKLAEALKGCSSIDILINNAGVYFKGESKEDFMRSFEVNSYVPFMVVQSLLPKLKSATSPKVIHISSVMGSVADTSSGGSYAYRASKAALNMVNKVLSLDHEWLTTTVMHPGWVKTSMGGDSAPLTVEESTQGIWKVILNLSHKDSGNFKDYQGRELPW